MSSSHFYRTFRTGFKLRGGFFKAQYLIIPTSLAVTATHSKIIYNDARRPEPHAETYELGLYLASRKELLSDREQSWNALKDQKYGIVRLIAHVYEKFHENVVEPVHTVFRFLKLATIFLPLLVLYPITYFGSAVTISSTTVKARDTYGSLIWYRLFRKMLEFAGPSFIKLGQWAGARTDIFTDGLCAELGKLNSNAKSHSLKHTKKQITVSLGVDSFEEVFEDFSEQYLGCGAIAQVYVGKLTEHIVKLKNVKLGPDNNRWCAVKVVHPNAAKEISRDLKIIKFFATAIDKIPTMEWLSLPAEVEQFSILMNLQLDMRIECYNLQKFNENFEHNVHIKFPRGYSELTSRKVLFEEYLHGLSMETFLKVKNHLVDIDLCKSVSDPFINSFLHMMILDNFTHSDLHAGNVLLRFIKTDKKQKQVLTPETEMFEIVQRLRKMYKINDTEFIPTLKAVLQEYEPQVCFIDAGLVTELNDRNRVNFMALFNALARFDGYNAGELMIERSRSPETAIDKELFALKVQKLVEKVRKDTFTLGTVSIGDLLNQMLSMVRGHHVRMEGDFVSIVVAILLLEGIGRQLDPDLDLFSSSLPLLREFGLRRENQGILANQDYWSMIKVWLGLELLHFMSLSVKQINNLVKTDQLCPNY